MIQTMQRHILEGLLTTSRNCTRRTRIDRRQASNGLGLPHQPHYSTSAAGSISIGRHVREALANRCPVVALESTVITHGLPEPQNLALALQLEREIADGLWWDDGRDDPSCSHSMRGVVVPATVGIIKGQLVVGLSKDQIEFLANLKLSRPIKASRRDLPVAQALGLSAGTTVSATMAIATSCTPVGVCTNAVGISVFATGGLGGVHLGGEHSMDISADLYEMARSPIGLVSSGFKSFLDTRRSLELLETFGCTVTSMKPFDQTYSASMHHGTEAADTVDLNNATAGGSDCHDIKLKTSQLFPGFFTAVNKDHVRSPWQCDSVQEAALILYHCLAARYGTGKSSGMPMGFTNGNTSRGHSGSQAAYLEQRPTKLDDDWICSAQLRNGRAMLLACPIPTRFSLESNDENANRTTTGPEAAIEEYSGELLDRISAEIDQRPGLTGAEKTPLILAELNRLTGGRTLEANLELLRNNARVGAHLAFEYSGLCQRIGVSLGATSSDVNNHRRDDESAKPTDGQVQGQLLSCKKAMKAAEGPRDVLTAGRNRQPLAQMGQSDQSDQAPELATSTHGRMNKSPLVVGCTMIDMHVRTAMDDRFKANPSHSGVTFMGEPRMILGGVGRNLAAALELLGHEPTFVTSLARDNLGEFARNELDKLATSCRQTKLAELADQNKRALEQEAEEQRFKIIEWEGPRESSSGEPSSCFALVLIDSLTGQCEFVIANLEARWALSRRNLAKEGLDLERLVFERPEVSGRWPPPLVVLDANLPADTIDFMLELGHRWRVPVFLEPTDVGCLPDLVPLLKRLRSQSQPNNNNNADNKLQALAYLSPNVIELETMLALFRDGTSQDYDRKETGRQLTVDQIQTMARELMERHLPQLGCLLVTMDKRGLLVGLRSFQDSNLDRVRPSSLFGHKTLVNAPTNTPFSAPRLIFKHYPPLEVIESPVSASGAGDCFAAGFISGLIEDLHLGACVELGFRASSCALREMSTVPESLRRLRVASNER